MELDFSLPGAATAVANELLSLPGAFDANADYKIIEGIATTEAENMNRRVFGPAGAIVSLPVPLLFDHDWEIPVGVVTEAKVTPDGLFFRARVIDGRFRWAPQCWTDLKTGRIAGVSVYGSGGGSYKWNLYEITVCQVGANRDAWIDLVKTVIRPRGRVYYFGETRQREIIHRDTRKTVRPFSPIRAQASA